MNQVNSFLKSYGITLPDGKAREQTILSGVYGVAEGLCLGVNPVALGAVKAIDMLIYKLCDGDEMHNTMNTLMSVSSRQASNSIWSKSLTVRVLSFAACAGALYAGGFALPAVSRIAVSVGLIVLQVPLSEMARQLGGNDAYALVYLTVQGFTVSTLIGANSAIMITVELINYIFKEILIKEVPGSDGFAKSGFSCRDERLFAAAITGILLKTPFMVNNMPARVATTAMAVLATARFLAHNTEYAPWLKAYV